MAISGVQQYGPRNLFEDAGKWTVTIAGGSIAGSHTYTTRRGLYVRHGVLVYLSFYLQVAAFDTDADGPALITKMPFNPLDAGSAIAAINLEGTGSKPTGFSSGYEAQVNNDTTMNLRYIKNNGNNDTLPIEIITDGTIVSGSLWYRIAL